MLKGDEPFSESVEYDVSDQWHADAAKTIKSRVRVWEDDEGFDDKTRGMRLIQRIDITSSMVPMKTPEVSSWYWITRPKAADDDGSKMGWCLA